MKVLIIKTGALGDVIMATPLIAAIQAAHMDAEISLVTSPLFAPLFEHWPSLRTYAFPLRGRAAMLRQLAWTRGQSFTRVYDLQGNDRTALLCAFSGIGDRVGNHPRFPYTHHPPDRWRGHSHIFERMNRVLAAAGVIKAEPRPWLPSTAEDERRVDAWLASSHCAAEDCVALHGGASVTRAEKRWPYFHRLAERLVECGLTPVWIGAAAEADANREAHRAVGGVDATNAFTITQLAEFGRRIRFAVTNDSGPMHVLSLAPIPVFGLFGPSDWRRNHALGQAAHVVTPPDGMGDDLGNLQVERVWARLEEARLV
jgi:ADP-heptose:LPS heptosyltransferase